MLKPVGKRGGLMFGLFAVTLAAGSAALWAQPSERPTIDASMTSLVAEVRALREAVERSGLMAAQSQLLLGRLQLQENRLGTLGRQAQQARDALTDAERVEYEVQARLRKINAALGGAVAAEHRQALADQAEGLKDELRLAQGKTQQLRQRDAAASAALSDEQQRWVDFNTRLEALERTISAAAASRGRE